MMIFEHYLEVHEDHLQTMYEVYFREGVDSSRYQQYKTFPTNDWATVPLDVYNTLHRGQVAQAHRARVVSGDLEAWLDQTVGKDNWYEELGHDCTVVFLRNADDILPCKLRFGFAG